VYKFYPILLKEGIMVDSVYKIITLVGTSSVSWEKAAANAVEKASKTLRDLRIAEVKSLICRSKAARYVHIAPRYWFLSSTKANSRQLLLKLVTSERNIYISLPVCSVKQ
jgi:flavin-binding protein dodecin